MVIDLTGPLCSMGIARLLWSAASATELSGRKGCSLGHLGDMAVRHPTSHRAGSSCSCCCKGAETIPLIKVAVCLKLGSLVSTGTVQEPSADEYLECLTLEGCTMQHLRCLCSSMWIFVASAGVSRPVVCCGVSQWLHTMQ